MAERMVVTLLGVGSRGDLQPMLALAMGLDRAGHRVRLAAMDPFAAMVKERGIEFVSLGPMPRRFTHPALALPVPAFNGLSGRALFWAAYSSMIDARLEAFRRACRHSDTIVFGGLAFPAYHLAEALGARAFWAAPTPHTATGMWADPFFAHRWYMPRQARSTEAPSGWRGDLRRLSYRAEEQLRIQLTLRSINRWRREVLGLAPLSRKSAASHQRQSLSGVLYGCSRHLLSTPTDWPAHAHITGYWYLPPPPGWTPPLRLTAFLAAGPAPVYIGFGSMSGREPERLGQLAVEALLRSGQRGILQGLAPKQPLPDTILAIGDLSHDWLFRHVALAVHHGGAGTSAAAALAGIPSIVVPLAYDQPFWAARLHQRGVAGVPLARKQLTAVQLAQRIDHDMTDLRLRAAARRLQTGVVAEQGVTRAIEVLEGNV